MLLTWLSPSRLEYVDGHDLKSHDRSESSCSRKSLGFLGSIGISVRDWCPEYRPRKQQKTRIAASAEWWEILVAPRESPRRGKNRGCFVLGMICRVIDLGGIVTDIKFERAKQQSSVQQTDHVRLKFRRMGSLPTKSGVKHNARSARVDCKARLLPHGGLQPANPWVKLSL